MLLNFDKLATSISGAPVIISGDTANAATYGQLVVEALSTSFADERLSGEEKYKRGELISKILKGGDIELIVEDLATIKMCVGKWGSVQLTYQIFNLIEGK